MTETSGKGASVRRVADPELPSFDLVVATVDRVGELGRLLESLAGQTYRRFRVLLVDQNEDDRLDALLREHSSLDLRRLHAGRGLSRARNSALPEIRADIVAFPDDDCVFPSDLLERVAQYFASESSLDGVTGRATDSASWKQDAATLTRENLWNRAISFTIFLRRAVIERVGDFDELLGLPSSSGEEIDYLIRALDAGARIEYDPTLVVMHSEKPVDLKAVGARDGASIGYLLRKHHYPARTVARMLVRPAAGAIVALARRDPARSRFQLATLRGRLAGYRESSSAKSSA
jgi:glycosyltransferase involved in cell wall biosynthesis